jgi:hypothetical protein
MMPNNPKMIVINGLIQQKKQNGAKVKTETPKAAC